MPLSNAFARRASRTCVSLQLIKAGRATQHGYAKSSDREIRVEGVGARQFGSLTAAAKIIHARRAEYTRQRLPSAPGDSTQAWIAVVWWTQPAGHSG